MISYREPVSLDIPVLVSFDRELFPYSPWSSAQFKEEFAGIPTTRHFLIAEDENQIVGYAGCFSPGEGIEADILSVGVVPSHRGQGIAKEFVNRLEQWCRNRNASAMMLEVKVDNVEAIGLYVALGYQKISIRMDYFGPGLDAQVMRKELS